MIHSIKHVHLAINKFFFQIFSKANFSIFEKKNRRDNFEESCSLRFRARTESIHFDSRKFDSPKWIKNHKNIFIKSIFFWFTWANHFIFDSDSFWFTLIFHIDSICCEPYLDSILVLIRICNCGICKKDISTSKKVFKSF